MSCSLNLGSQAPRSRDFASAARWSSNPSPDLADNANLGVDRHTLHVMAGHVPAIHDFLQFRKQDVDARDRRGHDGSVRCLTKSHYSKALRAFGKTSELTTLIGVPASYAMI